MAKKLIIDLTKCRECSECTVDCIYGFHPVNRGMVSLHETATFRFACRHCKEAPCIAICPAGALERNRDGIVERALNLCVACKSCVVACPFGTLMNHFFVFKAPVCDLCHFDEAASTLRCIETCPKSALSLTDEEPDEKRHIHRLNEKVLVKEYSWETLT